MRRILLTALFLSLTGCTGTADVRRSETTDETYTTTAGGEDKEAREEPADE